MRKRGKFTNEDWINRLNYDIMVMLRVERLPERSMYEY